MAKHYLVLAMRTPAFDEALIAPHIAFLDALKVNGQLVMTGGFSDASGGAYLLGNIDNLEAARAIVATDPIAVGGASELTVHEWNTR